VEMTEIAGILNNATKNSLLILDEVGRGTSTFDGLSIAWAVMEYISKNIKAKTLFSTHYHELTELEGVLEGVRNYHISVKELSTGIVFLRKIMRGSANKSFGIEVAAIAGLPKSVISRAKNLLKQLQEADINNPRSKSAQFKLELDAPSQGGASMHKAESQVLELLKDTDLDRIAPIDALNLLIELKSKLS